MIIRYRKYINQEYCNNGWIQYMEFRRNVYFNITQARYEQMIFAYKGYKHCQDQKSALMLCRATPYGKYVNPEHCEKESANMLECYHQTQSITLKLFRLLHSRKECTTQYKSVLDCLKRGSDSKWGHTSQGVCSKLLDEFAKC